MEPNFVTAVGIWFYSTSTNRYLYLLRDDLKNPYTWGLAGGKSEAGESLLETIHRECKEELGLDFVNAKFLPIEKFTSPDGMFCYHTFFCQVNREFVPKLNEEHLGYAWLDSQTWPKPMHPGLWSTVNLETVREKMSVLEKNLKSTNYYIDDSALTSKIFQTFA